MIEVVKQGNKRNLWSNLVLNTSAFINALVQEYFKRRMEYGFWRIRQWQTIYFSLFAGTKRLVSDFLQMANAKTLFAVLASNAFNASVFAIVRTARYFFRCRKSCIAAQVRRRPNTAFFRPSVSLKLMCANVICLTDPNRKIGV